jgi:hypothetical protein
MRRRRLSAQFVNPLIQLRVGKRKVSANLSKSGSNEKWRSIATERVTYLVSNLEETKKGNWTCLRPLKGGHPWLEGSVYSSFQPWYLWEEIFSPTTLESRRTWVGALHRNRVRIRWDKKKEDIWLNLGIDLLGRALKKPIWKFELCFQSIHSLQGAQVSCSRHRTGPAACSPLSWSDCAHLNRSRLRGIGDGIVMQKLDPCMRSWPGEFSDTRLVAATPSRILGVWSS